MARILDSSTLNDRALIEQVRDVAHPLRPGDLSGYDPLLDMIGDARIVMIGEASHGTHEFYRERALITTRLIREKGFSFVGVEGDWPEAYRVHRYACGRGGTIDETMGAFHVFPTWMWGNWDARHFVEWLRAHNAARRDESRKVGFYGLDLYSLYDSMRAVIEFLEKVDPEAARVARERYACFDPFSGNKDLYAYSAGLGISQSCEDEAVAMLLDLQRKREEYVDISPDDSYFYASMSAKSARDGERYYRSMYRSDEVSWNIRDTHMVETLDAVLQHYGPDARAVVWEHNTHIGDFRATADAGPMVNVGQLVRERYPGQSIAIGFGTYDGSVTAATGWGEPPRYMPVPQARAGSYDNLFHQARMERFLLLLKPLLEEDRARELDAWRGQRAIGVVYHPEYERGNYVPTRLAQRYDAYIHIDHTQAVRPLAIEQTWVPTSQDQTYPSGY